MTTSPPLDRELTATLSILDETADRHIEEIRRSIEAGTGDSKVIEPIAARLAADSTIIKALREMPVGPIQGTDPVEYGCEERVRRAYALMQECGDLIGPFEAKQNVALRLLCMPEVEGGYGMGVTAAAREVGITRGYIYREPLGQTAMINLEAARRDLAGTSLQDEEDPNVLEVAVARVVEAAQTARAHIHYLKAVRDATTRVRVETARGMYSGEYGRKYIPKEIGEIGEYPSGLVSFDLHLGGEGAYSRRHPQPNG